MSKTTDGKVAAHRIPTSRELLQRACDGNTGHRGWREWKQGETADVFNLLDSADRAQPLDVSFDGDLNIAYGIKMPVPLWPQGPKLRIGHGAIFHLHYRENWRYEAPAGWEPLGLVDPIDIFHPNCAPARRGAICLGNLPPGVSPKELVLMGYYALTLQDVVLDETDPHGVLNPIACEFYRNNPQHLPLTTAGLMDPWEPAEEESEVTR